MTDSGDLVGERVESMNPPSTLALVTSNMEEVPLRVDASPSTCISIF